MARYKPSNWKLGEAAMPASETGLLPCAHCGQHLEKSEAFSNRMMQIFLHPTADNADDACFLENTRVAISVRDADNRMLARWNRRASTPSRAALLAEVEVTPEMIAAAWQVMKRHRVPKLGVGPAFREAIIAAFEARAALEQSQP